MNIILKCRRIANPAERRMVCQNRNSSFIVITFIIVIAVFVCGCSAYKVESNSKVYSQEDVENFVESGHYYSNNYVNISSKVLNSLKKVGTTLTSDSIAFKKRLHSFLSKYGKNKEGDKGYFIIKSIEKNEIETENICILYKIEKKKSIIFTYYRIPFETNEWDEVKKHLVGDNFILRLRP